MGNRSIVNGFRYCYSNELLLIIDTLNFLCNVKSGTKATALCALRKIPLNGVFWKVIKIIKINTSGQNKLKSVSKV